MRSGGDLADFGKKRITDHLFVGSENDKVSTLFESFKKSMSEFTDYVQYAHMPFMKSVGP